MRQKGLLTKSILALLILGFFSVSAKAGDWEGQVKLKLSENKTAKRLGDTEKLMKKKSGLFNLDVDVQLGLDAANTSIEPQPSTTNVEAQKLESSESKLGPTLGAIVNVDFFGFGFTSGFQYSSKGFETVGNVATNYNYMNIPLLFYIGFEAGKIRVDGNVGPYFGLLISQDESTVLAVKNFDLGITANLSGAYMFNKYMGVLLGCKYEYGGLNNLASNEFIKKVTSSTLFFYSGLKFEI